MADDSKKADESPTSVRLDAELKGKLKEAAETARQSQADFIATAIEMRLNGICPTCARDRTADTSAAYWDQRFADWCATTLKGARGAGPMVVIGADEGSAGRRVYMGKLKLENVRDSVVWLTDVQGKTRAHEVISIPRSAIRVWDDNLNTHELLVRSGYFRMN